MGKKGGGVRIKQVGPKAPSKNMLFNPMDELAIPREEMIQLPPPPDRSYQLFWPIHETFTMDVSAFQVIYPSYLDSTKTIAQGRRIGKDIAVEMPTVSDLSLALQSLQIRHVLQPYKGYSRDIETLWDNPGRVKVDLQRPTPSSAPYGTKRELLKALAQIIPTLPERQRRLEQQAMMLLVQEQKAAEESSQQQPLRLQSQSSSSTSSATAGTAAAASGKITNKKKGKKKR